LAQGAHEDETIGSCGERLQMRGKSLDNHVGEWDLADGGSRLEFSDVVSSELGQRLHLSRGGRYDVGRTGRR
jgi:hypothetical protein